MAWAFRLAMQRWPDEKLFGPQWVETPPGDKVARLAPLLEGEAWFGRGSFEKALDS